MARHAKKSRAVDILELVALVVAALVAAWLLRSFVCEPFIIPSASMTDTLKVGDRLIGEKLSYRTGEPEVGDIVTFIDPEDGSTTLIKRVIATEGQTVLFSDGKLFVDGAEMDEPYTDGKPSFELDQHASNLSENIHYPYVVPEGCVWVMGDNRTNSLDSRYFGAISIESITSKACFVYWPLEDIGTI